MTKELEKQCKYHYVAMEKNFYECALMEDGRFFIKQNPYGQWEQKEWWSKRENGKPWIPAKRKSFVSLIKMAIRDGDYLKGLP